jgi:16S rRNA G966 N2-methylase RsmD
MGAKTGYADTILRVLGLMPGQRAERYLWCEPDPGVRLLLHAYRDAALAKAAAAIIRSWAAEDPRALWERLRAEGPPRLSDEGADAGEVARWAVSHALTGMSGGYDCASERAARGERWGGDVRDFVPNRMSRIDAMPATIAPDAREVDPREVARWAFVQSSNTMIALDSNWRNTGAGGSTFHGGERAGDPFRAAVPLERTCALPALVHPDARTIDPPTLPPGTVVFIDPPYVATTPYAHDLPRAEVVTLARRWAAAGAIVAISEAEPIPELVTEGWHAVRIDAERVGQKRTFSKQQAEWLTLSRAPAWVPAVQASLFGGAR